MRDLDENEAHEVIEQLELKTMLFRDVSVLALTAKGEPRLRMLQRRNNLNHAITKLRNRLKSTEDVEL